ncbi:hypothetical protein FOZ62_021780, partial [Perkinsus olseni]
VVAVMEAEVDAVVDDPVVELGLVGAATTTTSGFDVVTGRSPWVLCHFRIHLVGPNVTFVAVSSRRGTVTFCWSKAPSSTQDRLCSSLHNIDAQVSHRSGREYYEEADEETDLTATAAAPRAFDFTTDPFGLYSSKSGDEEEVVVEVTEGIVVVAVGSVVVAVVVVVVDVEAGGWFRTCSLSDLKVDQFRAGTTSGKHVSTEESVERGGV